MTSSAEQGFPLSLEALPASMFEVLKQNGVAREIALLLESNVQGFQSNYDNWNGGTTGWSLRLGLDLGPLPVFLRGGEASYSRVEPDFVLLKDGILMVVEVDGDTYHRESPAEAHRRLAPLDHEGAKIERVTSEQCGSPQAAKKCADELLRILEKRIAQIG